MKNFLLFILLFSLLPLCAAFPDYTATFQKNSEGWAADGKAVLSTAGHRPDSGSLMLEMSDENAGDAVLPSWTSPLLPLKKEAAVLSFWTADNYLKLQDFSYSASLAVTSCSADGTSLKEISREYTEWDTTLVSPYMWGLRTEDALIWKYHEIRIPAGHDFIRLTFAYRAAMLRGRCYLSDIQLAPDSAPAGIQLNDSKKSEEKKSRTAWLSCPVPGGVFYSGDPMRYDFHWKVPDGEAGHIQDTRIRLTVMDFFRNILWKGEVTPEKAAPVKDTAFYDSEFAKRNALTPQNHLCSRFALSAQEITKTGILYILKAECIGKDGLILGEDTALYGVVDPPVIPEHPEKSYFFTRDQVMLYYDSASLQGQSATEQEFTRKMHSFRCADLSLSYKWIQHQPHYPGPIDCKPLLPNYPLQLYMPNIEQVRIPRMIPPEARIPLDKITYYAGYKDRPQVDYNAEAYADYIVEYVRQNRASITHVVPSGLERAFSHRVPILQKRVYEKLKALDPSLKVGFTINSISLKDFADNQLYDYADFLNVHMYGSAVDFNYSDVTAYKEFYQKTLKKKAPEFTLTEGALRLPVSYMNYAFGTLRGIWSLLSNRFTGIYYYHQRNTRPLADPDLGDELTSDPASSGYDSYRFVQLVDRPVVSPELRMAPGHNGKRWLNTSASGAGASIMPTIATMAYSNLIQDFDYLPYQRMRTRGAARFFYFGNKERTAIGIDPQDEAPEQAYLVKCNAEYVVRDLLGRTTKITPQNGVSYIQPGKYPVSLLFSEAVVPDFVPISEATLLLDNSVAGGKMLCNAPKLSGDFMEDASWKMRIEGEEGLEVQSKSSSALSIDLPETCRVGKREVRLLLQHKGKILGLWQSTFMMQSPLTFTLQSAPPRKGKPGFELLIQNDSAKRQKGDVVFEDKWFCQTLRPVQKHFDFSVPPHSRKNIFFPVDAKGVTTNFNEIVNVKVKLASGEEQQVSGRIHFRFVPPCKKAPVIDGNLKDWPLEKLHPVAIERIRLPNTTALPECTAKANGVCYAMCRDHTLYLAFVVEDTTPVSRSMNVNFWMDDNILLNLYPWRTPEGIRLNAGYYRSHFGFYKDGTLHQYWEEKYAPVGAPRSTDGILKACQHTPTGYVYEIACPEKELHPLKIEPGNGFRLSWCIFDTLEDIKVLYFTGKLSFFGGAAVNYNTNPRLWYEFIFR